MLPNYHGHSYTTRFLQCAVPKNMYSGSNSTVFDQVMDFAASEADQLITSGVSHPVRGTFYGCLLKITGDWPWLVKSGNLKRSFWNVQKRKEPVNQNNKRRRGDAGGICHLCLAGQPTVDFEEIGVRSPQWLHKEFLNYQSSSCFPNGGWHKGELTTMLMQYIEHRFLTEDWSQLSISLKLAGGAAVSANAFLRLLYNWEAWLPAPIAKRAGELGQRFLRRYSTLCTMAREAGRNLWILQPEFHAFHHLVIYLLRSSERGCVLNPLVFSTQQSEDFIGRPSRLSRRVTGQRPCAERVIDRYLRSAFHQWQRAGYIIKNK